MATRSTQLDKPDFAKRALRFVDRALGRARRLPGFPMLWIVGAAATVLMIVTGGFGTTAMPFGQRSLLWTLLIGWSLIKWQAWFAWRVREPKDWMRAALIGTILLNLLLPIEIALALRAVGIDQPLTPLRTWAEAVVIAAVLSALIALFKPRRVAPAAPPAPNGVLARARVSPDALAAIEAEDHYCRLRLTDGSSTLIHARFADALADVTSLDGTQTHRGAWVAAAAVTGAEREGRLWRLKLAGGARIPVSARYAATVGARGWLRR